MLKNGVDTRAKNIENIFLLLTINPIFNCPLWNWLADQEMHIIANNRIVILFSLNKQLANPSRGFKLFVKDNGSPDCPLFRRPAYPDNPDILAMLSIWTILFVTAWPIKKNNDLQKMYCRTLLFANNPDYLQKWGLSYQIFVVTTACPSESSLYLSYDKTGQSLSCELWKILLCHF